MSKLIFWVVVIVVGLLVARISARNAVRKQQRQPPRPHASTDLMVRCAHCGIHLPAAEAVRRKGYNYCGLAHSLRGPRS